MVVGMVSLLPFGHTLVPVVPVDYPPPWPMALTLVPRAEAAGMAHLRRAVLIRKLGVGMACLPLLATVSVVALDMAHLHYKVALILVVKALEVGMALLVGVTLVRVALALDTAVPPARGAATPEELGLVRRRVLTEVLPVESPRQAAGIARPMAWERLLRHLPGSLAAADCFPSTAAPRRAAASIAKAAVDSVVTSRV